MDIYCLSSVNLKCDIDSILGARIIAEAQNDSTGACSGGSGGLIRLNASKVSFIESGIVTVKGTDVWIDDRVQYCIK